MFTLDNTTIIASVVLFLVALLTSFLNPLLRKVSIAEYGLPTLIIESEEIGKEEESIEEEKETITEPAITEGQLPTLPPISIIFTPRDNAQELAKNLPLYLNQDYPVDSQVIVVVPQNDHETNDVLKYFASNSHPYTTFIPESPRYMSRKKPVVTLGAKAAECDWVIMADICRYPKGDNWLQAIARSCQEDRESVVGYTRYEDETPAYRHSKRHYLARYFMCEYQYDKSYARPFNALAFRKSRFLSEEGLRRDLKYIRGEYDLVVSKYASGNNLVFENSLKGTLIGEAPIKEV